MGEEENGEKTQNWLLWSRMGLGVEGRPECRRAHRWKATKPTYGTYLDQQVSASARDGDRPSIFFNGEPSR